MRDWLRVLWCVDWPLRGQARSHRGFVNTPDPLWERACPRRPHHQSNGPSLSQTQPFHETDLAHKQSCHYACP
ncbi:hypothetical protein EI534_26875 [Pseudomonas frederiksbergensis]|nr:hypothetical protein [Pseudomonas frederiksbergensis]